ncbi:site-specific DNA-methyltransferase [Paenibacillus sp. JMULE4]|uniref:site-specific DNA-methyltransferase n=1 Tax=Paenibacillus sp. JMULE4 TaxID=2518342 RepID=UPI001575FCFB|nr:site-specific DNA-methyltransferase [Paenibacillus sp. JMULE4]NTZ18836.1 site-specific DNA-methyltransferase [Paenibacillus sp. JMULE4]
MNNIELEKQQENKGSAYLYFEPREELSDFVNDRSTIYWLESKAGYNAFSENMVIKGDNLTAMATMRVSWLLTENEKKFDVIYIDPPYNVGGNTGYKNTFKGQSEGNFGWAGDHGKWLDFMEPRLKMAKLLMKDEGIIFVSICDQEYARLLLLMEDIFGESNLIGTFIWDKKQGSPSESISVVHEYIICFAKNKSKSWKLSQLKPGCSEIIAKSKELVKKYGLEKAQPLLKKWIKEQEKKGNISSGLSPYCYIHPQSHRVFRDISSCAQDDNGSRCRKPLKHPITGKDCPVPSKGWKWSEETLMSMVDYNNVVEYEKGYICGQIIFGKDHNTVPQKISYLDEKDRQQPPSIIRTKSSGAGDLPPGVSFPTPKPLELLETLISFVPSKNIRVLDFFGGSGTTAHAVLNLNEQDDGNREYVLIEQVDKFIEEAILPRLEHVAGKDKFGVFSLAKKEVDSLDLLRAFQKHAEEFLRTTHSLNHSINYATEGVKVVGYNTSTKTLVATLTQELRSDKSKTYFRKEMQCLAKSIMETSAVKVILYRIETDNVDREEPWVGIKSDIFSNTTCEKFTFVSLPSAIIRAWNETLNALEAV